jgi:hypothetical protein
MTPQSGDFVRVRTRRWLVEGERLLGDKVTALRLACVDDDAQGEVVEVLWDAELDGSVLQDEGWASVAKFGTDDPKVFSAYLRALRWNTATAADRDLFQAPFRAGIHQDAYQLLPVRKALRLPRVNLLIADDVGAGKTVEAGLVLREMLLRRRVDLVLVAAPAGMVRQWQDELEAKFGLSFTLIDREHLATLRRERGYTANPWTSGSRFIISHSLMADETYVGGLRDMLGNFRPHCCGVWTRIGKGSHRTGTRASSDDVPMLLFGGRDPHWDDVMISAAARRPSSALSDRPEIPRPSDHRPRCPGRRLFWSRSEEECGRVLRGSGRP